MNSPPIQREPARYLHPTVDGYLTDLSHAASLAAHYRDVAKVGIDGVWIGKGGPVLATDHHRTGRAYGSPVDWLYGEALSQQESLHSAALRTYAEAAGWYASAALISLQTMLAAEDVTAQQVEGRIPRRPQRFSPDGDRGGDWWNAECRPELPADGVLDTGHLALDRPVHKRLVDLRRAYGAAGDFAMMAEHPYEDADDHSSESWISDMAEAQKVAETIPDLLVDWAELLAHTASFCRSPARGYKAAAQPADATVGGDDADV